MPEGMERNFFWVIVESAVILSLAVLMWGSVNKYWAAFLVLATFSHIYPIYGEFSRETLRQIFFLSVWYLIVFAKVDKKHLAIGIYCVVLINLFFIVLQLFDKDPFQSGTTDIVTGMMANANELSSLVALSSFAVWMLTPKMWPFIILPGLYFAHSGGGVVAVACGMAVYASILKRQEEWQRPIVILLVLSLIAAFFTCEQARAYILQDTGFIVRMDVWTNQWWPLFKHVWLLGAGLGHWGVIFRWHVHNDILQGGFVMGACLWAIILLYSIDIFRRSIGRNDMVPYIAGLVSVFVSACSWFLFDIGPTAMMAVALMAITEKQLRAYSLAKIRR